ncbi:unnamed protein product [Adineta steineri]|uniref:DUF4614 domain-containing protein n=2 Tax=Adineta steineri TaxID=433720 RepID=A0A815DBK4_9BILA|nr:unnamed protein product [Adineta steineri]CAF3530390.1 unnamed protein product [Adineta steineri]
MSGTISDIAARMEQRKQRLQEEQQRLDRKANVYAQNPDAISEPSEMESSRQAPKPKRRHHRSSNKSPFDDDSSLQFDYGENQNISTTTTSSSTPRQPNKFVKKSSTIPVTTEKISAARSPRDVSSPRMATKSNSNKNVQPVSSSTGFVQSSILARAAHRTQLHAQGIELEPGAFDRPKDDDESSSDATSTSGTKNLFGSGKKTFLKKTANTVNNNQVPELLHLNSETNNSEREEKKTKHKKNTRSSSVIDTEDDSSLDFLGEGSLSEDRKTPILTPRKSILKSPKEYTAREKENFVQFSKELVEVQTDDERVVTPTKMSRSTTPRRVRIASKPTNDYDETVPSETESISTAIDTVDEDDTTPITEHISESPANNMFENLIMNDEPLVKPNAKKKSPRRISPVVTIKRPASPSTKFHHIQRTVSDISDDDNTKVEDIPEEISVASYSEDFSSVIPTETSTPRAPIKPKTRVENQSQPTRKVSTDDHGVQVDLMSAPFQSSLNQVHSIYLINQNDLNEARPSSLIRSVIEPSVLQSLLTTNPVLLAVDDLIREQSSLLRSFIHLQRTYYESTIRSIRPEHVYVTKDNSLRFIAEQQQQSRMYYQAHDDSISN